jgi:hypothetical protein
MSFIAQIKKLFANDKLKRKLICVKWSDHPYTKSWARKFGYMLRHAKEMKFDRERVGRSADYWQGQIDALTAIDFYKHGVGYGDSCFTECIRGRCLICSADEESPCDEEKHKQAKNDSVV